jgi:DNA/RNA endonuclease YhcR with UshA esterase domain
MRKAALIMALTLMVGRGLGIGEGPARALDDGVTPIGKITTEYLGKFATVQGTIAGERAFKSGTRFTVRDESGEITLVLFDRALKQVPKRDQLGEGATVKASGKVDFFNEQAQIVPIRGADVVLIAPAPAITATAIGALSAADAGRRVQVSGAVTEAGNFSAGFKLKLNDGSGQVAVVLFENVFDGLARGIDVNVGATLTVTGRLEEFAGGLEVIPSSAAGVRVAAPTRREVRAYALGAITGNDHNAVVRVEGQVAAVDAFENGLDVLVKDESGAQVVRLWKVVAERVPLKAGDALSAVGRVKASRKGIVIDVAMPGDIFVKK